LVGLNRADFDVMADAGEVVNEPKAVAGKPMEPPSQPAAPRIHPEVRRQQVFDIFYVLLGFRIVNAILSRTFFQPDEYFQALEPAWRLAFGPESGAWLTWVSLSPSAYVSEATVH
jgi:hypothetical protein